MESIKLSWVSYTTGAFYTACQRLQFGFISMQFHMSLAWPWELSSCSSRVAGNWLGRSIPSARHFSFSFHKPPSACVLRLVTKHMPVSQGSHRCSGPPKAFSLALKLSQEHFQWSEMHKHHFLQEKGTLMGNAQQLCYPIPGQSHKFIVPSESTLNITYQQWLCPCSQPLKGISTCVQFILEKYILQSSVAGRHECTHLFSVLNQCLQMDVSSKHRHIP